MSPKAYLYTFVAIAVALVLFVGGFVFFSPQEQKVQDSAIDSTPTPTSAPAATAVPDSGKGCNSSSCNTEDVERVVYQGTVEKKADDSVTGASHELRSGGGDAVAYLKADDQKLLLVEGMEVEISGVMERLIGAGVPLVMVEEVRFK